MRKVAAVALLALTLMVTAQFLPLTVAAAGTIPGPAQNIILTITPPKLPADGGSYPAAIISLTDGTGLPSAALSAITVFLSSSQTNIASVPNSVTINPGQEYAIANITTTTQAGPAQITAHAEGFVAPAPALVTTVTPSGFPSKLKIFASPSTFLPRSDSGTVIVEVVDDAGLPTKAINPIPILLTSSNQSIANLDQSTLTIQQGSIFSTGTFHTNSPGNAVFTAVSSGYGSGTTEVTVDSLTACVGICSAYKLSLKLIPGLLPSDGQTYNLLEVGLQTSAGTPATSSSDVVVQLTSDKSDLASVISLVTIPSGTISTLTQVTTSSLAGTANITASSAGLLPATAAVNTIVPAPSKIQVYIAPPSTAYTANGNYPILVVQLQDSNGNPARARANTEVTVTSSNGTLMQSFVTLTIPIGKDYVFSNIKLHGDGKSTLTATSQGLASSQGSLNVVPSPLQVSLVLSSPPGRSFIFANQTATFTLDATFLGQPLDNVNVTWTASAGTVTPSAGPTTSSGTTSTVFKPATFGA